MLYWFEDFSLNYTVHYKLYFVNLTAGGISMDMGGGGGGGGRGGEGR